MCFMLLKILQSKDQKLWFLLNSNLPLVLGTPFTLYKKKINSQILLKKPEVLVYIQT